jgi:hypothetical protein
MITLSAALPTAAWRCITWKPLIIGEFYDEQNQKFAFRGRMGLPIGKAIVEATIDRFLSKRAVDHGATLF